MNRLAVTTRAERLQDFSEARKRHHGESVVINSAAGPQQAIASRELTGKNGRLDQSPSVFPLYGILDDKPFILDAKRRPRLLLGPQRRHKPVKEAVELRVRSAQLHDHELGPAHQQVLVNADERVREGHVGPWMEFGAFSLTAHPSVGNEQVNRPGFNSVPRELDLRCELLERPLVADAVPEHGEHPSLGRPAGRFFPQSRPRDTANALNRRAIAHEGVQRRRLIDRQWVEFFFLLKNCAHSLFPIPQNITYLRLYKEGLAATEYVRSFIGRRHRRESMR